MPTIAIIGHVDHGKSTLCGRLMHLTGNIEPHVLASMQDHTGKVIWSRALDIYEEERVRSKTHEFALAAITVPRELVADVCDLPAEDKIPLTLVDTPGHKIYIRSMIDGISSGVDAAVVVVSAASDEFERAFSRGTLREDIILARCADIVRFIVAVNKMDAVNTPDTVNTSAEDTNISAAMTARYDEIRTRLTAFFKGLGITAVEFVPVSAMTGEGIIAPMTGGGQSAMFEHSLLSRMMVPSVVRPEYQWIVSAEIRAKAKIMHCENIISAGFSCWMHHRGEEVEIIIGAISVGKRTFARAKESADITIILPTPIKHYRGQMLILRKDDYTIGYAKIP